MEFVVAARFAVGARLGCAPRLGIQALNARTHTSAMTADFFMAISL
jgi:hypothetical protein